MSYSSGVLWKVYKKRWGEKRENRVWNKNPESWKSNEIKSNKIERLREKLKWRTVWSAQGAEAVCGTRTQKG